MAAFQSYRRERRMALKKGMGIFSSKLPSSPFHSRADHNFLPRSASFLLGSSHRIFRTWNAWKDLEIHGRFKKKGEWFVFACRVKKIPLFLFKFQSSPAGSNFRHVFFALFCVRGCCRVSLRDNSRYNRVSIQIKVNVNSIGVERKIKKKEKKASAYFYNETRVKITSFDSRKQHTSRHALDIASFFRQNKPTALFPFSPSSDWFSTALRRPRLFLSIAPETTFLLNLFRIGGFTIIRRSSCFHSDHGCSLVLLLFALGVYRVDLLGQSL